MSNIVTLTPWLDLNGETVSQTKIIPLQAPMKNTLELYRINNQVANCNTKSHRLPSRDFPVIWG